MPDPKHMDPFAQVVDHQIAVLDALRKQIMPAESRAQKARRVGLQAGVMAVAMAAASVAMAFEQARVVTVSPVYLQTRVVCGEGVSSSARPESAVSMRGFGGGRSGLSVCSEALEGSATSAPEGGVAMRGFAGGQRASTGAAETLAGYRVVIDYRGRQRLTALPNHPNETVGVDPHSMQILALTDFERSYDRSPPRFADCASAYERKDDARAREVCGWLAERGDPGAQNKLANLWFDGRGGGRDIREALRWDKLGAEQGHGRSMNNLGWMYEKGQGVPRDLAQARYWYSRAAEAMDVCGLNSLATLFDKGIGQPADAALAAEYYRRSAQFGPSDAPHCTALAQNSLGALYETGRGVPQNIPEAIRWYESAVRLGDSRAQRNLDRVLGQHGRPQPSFVAYPSVTYTLPSDAALQRQTAPAPVQAVVETAPPPGLGPKLAAKLPRAARQNSAGIAILIANLKYDHRDIPPVMFASNDVELMKHYVTQTLGYEQVKVLDGASKGDLESYFGNRETPGGLLAKWVAEMKPGEAEVFVYYSGHGAPGLQDKRGYLLPRDANPATVPISGYSIDVLYQNLAQLNAKKVTVVLEACFSGMSAGGTLVPRSSALVLKPKLPPAPADNMLIISASGADQVASWDEEARLGIMTRHFIEGATGAADTNQDQKISGLEMQDYLIRKVATAARLQYSREQQPVILGATQETLVGR